MRSALHPKRIAGAPEAPSWAGTGAAISVNVTDSLPNGLLSGTDTFDVGSQTIVLGNSSSTLVGSLRDLSTGEVVAGGMITASAGTIESTPLEVLVDFPQSSSSANAEKASHGHHQKQ